MRAKKPDLPLVYSCSGCSGAAQMANHIALQLDRVAEMSCISNPFDRGYRVPPLDSSSPDHAHFWCDCTIAGHASKP